VLEDAVLQLHLAEQPCAKDVRLHHLGESNAAARRLVGVAGPDAVLGGAEPGVAPGLLHGLVQGLVVGHDHVGAVADDQVLADLHAPPAQARDLRHQRDGVHNDAVADDAQRLRPQDAAGHQPQHELLFAYVDGVARVGTALETDDQVEPGRQGVYDLSLALVAPLQADKQDRLAHARCPFMQKDGSPHASPRRRGQTASPCHRWGSGARERPG